MSEQAKKQEREPQWKINCMRMWDFFKASGDKQRNFAKFIGVSQPAFNQWIHLKASPTVDTMEKAAGKLGVPLKCMVCRDDNSVCITCNSKRRPPRTPPPA